ncbi:DUF418 domain-containing protein [Bowmanella yangjiangensis]|uniref:DUF418 domain-containing protein n=1 Tax=Bowmanella yangjiangensis TaxID=2811230 RepID=A0ABS3CWP5_9ALTE|nr:DUF418 domain-containing protein [Bowmanella yangjiangensis]MBN7820044.1 DUF418 domain-containing protein [Bowmanella yangjiangensis]
MLSRNQGFDLARALALFGMVIVNFKLVMGAEQGQAHWLYLTSLLEGRAAALFVILAGIGIALISAKAQQNGSLSQRRQVQTDIFTRGVLLLGIGLAYITIWPADILHFYGCYFMLAALVCFVPDRRLLQLAIALMLLFPLMLLLVDYDRHWDWTTLTYHNMWSLDGLWRRILFNGFHPVIPWLAFLLFGLWLGRRSWYKPATQRVLLLLGVSLWLIAEGLSWLGSQLLASVISDPVELAEASILVSTDMIPPMPLYMLSASGSALVVICLCQYVANSAPRLCSPLIKTGQMALSLYVAHVILGMGTLEALGMLGNQTIEMALLAAGVFSLFAIVLSVICLSLFERGPLEWLFRLLLRSLSKANTKNPA